MAARAAARDRLTKSIVEGARKLQRQVVCRPVKGGASTVVRVGMAGGEGVDIAQGNENWPQLGRRTCLSRAGAPASQSGLLQSEVASSHPSLVSLNRRGNTKRAE